MPINPQTEIDEVRLNCGSPGESNLSDADIDSALSGANEETTERTGLLESDVRYPSLRRKMKLLLATAYLLIRFSNMDKVRDSIIREVERLTTQMKTFESTDEDEESIIDSDPFATADAQQINYWVNGQKRTTSGTRTIRYGSDFWRVRTGELSG
jgi:hypothetical protein